jgi:hypothetical protein
MASLSTTPLIIASLNAMLASRNRGQSLQNINDEEVADLIQALAESDSPHAQPKTPHPGWWNWSPVKNV